MTKRDIKLRAWDTFENKYWTIETWHLEDEYVDLIEPNKNIADMTAQRAWRRDSEVIIEQYTEVKDINGVEFYDNDIVRVEVSQPFEEVELGGRLSVIGVVKYDEGAYWIDWGTGRTRLWNETLQMTVLGNIHENPELLEGQ